MFTESDKVSKTPLDRWVDDWGRRRPNWFSALLVVLAVALTLGLLTQPGYTLIMYQGF